MPYLIDRDVLIEISSGRQAAREYVDVLRESWAISQVSALELIVGARDKRDLVDIEAFLPAYVIAPLRDHRQNGTPNSTAYTSLIPRLRQLQ